MKTISDPAWLRANREWLSKWLERPVIVPYGTRKPQWFVSSGFISDGTASRISPGREIKRAKSEMSDDVLESMEDNQLMALVFGQRARIHLPDMGASHYISGFLQQFQVMPTRKDRVRIISTEWAENPTVTLEMDGFRARLRRNIWRIEKA